MQLLLSITGSMLLWVIVSSAQTEMKTNYVESKFIFINESVNRKL